MLTKKKVAHRIWAISSDTQPEIGRAFIRFQEYYENADLKGRKDLTVQDIEEWWLRTKDEDNQSYYEHWLGFNIPGRVIVELAISPDFRPEIPLAQPRYHKEENEFLALLSDLSAEEIVSSYFIGMWKDSDDVLSHELAHGLYATNPLYRSEQAYNLATLPRDIYNQIRSDLIECGYHQDVVHDEIQAYLSSYPDALKETFDTEAYNSYTAPFEATFKKFTSPS